MGCGWVRAWSYAVGCFAATAITLVAPAAMASPVTVNPGQYQGPYYVGNGSETVGPSTVDLSAGTYVVNLPNVTNLTFAVDSSGNVTSESTASSTGGPGTFTFLNTTVSVDPGQYQGAYEMDNGPNTPPLTGAQTFALIPGISSWALNLPFVGDIPFSIDANGNVTCSTASALGSGSTLTFANTTVSVNPGAYEGPYEMDNGPNTPPTTGAQSFVLVPGFSSWAVNLPFVGNISFGIDSNGNVSTTFAGASASGATLTFANATVNVNPGAYAGPYEMDNGPNTPPLTGSQSFVLVPGFSSWAVNLPFVGNISFGVDASGNVSTTFAGASASGSTLTFANATVHVVPGEYEGAYEMNNGPNTPALTGQQSFVLVPGFSSWALNLPFVGDIPFAIDSHGNVSTTFAGASASGATLTFANATVSVQPGEYPGPYEMGNGPNTPALAGPQTFVLVPGFSGWELNLPFIGDISFALDGAGNVSTTSDSATAATTTLTLLNVEVTATAPSAPASLFLGPVADGPSPLTTILVPGAHLTQGLGVNQIGSATFIVYNSCALSQSELTVGSTAISLSCSAPPPPPPPSPPVAIISPVSAITSATQIVVNGTVTDSAGIPTAMFLVNGAPQGGNLTIGSGGAVSATLQLSAGVNTIVLRAQDPSGSTGSASTQIVSDPTPPVLAIVSPTTGTVVGSAVQSLTVTVSDLTDTQVTIGGQSYDVPTGSGTVSGNVTLLSQGNNTVTVTAVDAAGNPSSTSITLLLDSSAPVLSSDVANGSELAAQVGSQLLVTLTVDDASATNVVVSPTGATYAIADGGGNVATSIPLVPGTNTFTFTVTNEVGRVSVLTESVIYDPAPPAGSIVYPSSGAFVRGTIEATVSATDAYTGIASLSFAVDSGAAVSGSLTGSDWIAPITTTGLADGSHTLTIVITDGVGTSTTLSESFKVDNTPPLVSFVSPASGSYLDGTVTVDVSATDAGSGIAAVSISLGNTTLATCTASPCTIALNTTTLEGPFTLVATATDAAGNVASVSLQAIADNDAPQGFLVAPANGAIVTSSVTVTVDVTTPYFHNGSCEVGGTSLGTFTTPTFSDVFSLATTIDGPLLVSCTATDLAGVSSTDSATVNVKNWTEHFSPESLNLRNRDGRVTMAVRGSTVGLLLPLASSLKLGVPGATPVPEYAVHFHISPDDDGDCDDRTPNHVDVKFLRSAVDDAVLASIATNTIQLSTPFTMTLLNGAHPIGGDSIVAIHP